MFCCFKNKKQKYEIIREEKLLSGNINKKHNILKKWTNIYFELYKNYLVYKKDKYSKKFTIIDLSDCFIEIKLYDKVGKDFSFCINYKKKDLYFYLVNQEVYDYFISSLANSNVINKREFQRISKIKKVNPWIYNSIN